MARDECVERVAERWFARHPHNFTTADGVRIMLTRADVVQLLRARDRRAVRLMRGTFTCQCTPATGKGDCYVCRVENAILGRAPKGGKGR